MFEEIKDEIIKYGKIAGDRNLTPGISGNISVRCGDNIVITSSGSANSFMSKDDICVIDFDGNLVEGTRKAYRVLQKALGYLCNMSFSQSVSYIFCRKRDVY